jgi:hypothetical protein
MSLAWRLVRHEAKAKAQQTQLSYFVGKKEHQPEISKVVINAPSIAANGATNSNSARHTNPPVINVRMRLSQFVLNDYWKRVRQ